MIEKRILVIDDDIDSLDIVKTLLTREGFSVITAKDGNEGLELLKSSNPDLVISDVLLPGLNGYEILEYIKSDEDLKEIPVILFTAVYVTDDDREFAYSLGVDRYLFKADALIKKPFKKDLIINSVYELLGLKNDEYVINEDAFSIAVVEDDPDTIEYISIILENEGYRVDKFLDPLIFIEQYKKGVYDLLLLDYNMPGMNGIDIVKKVRMTDKETGIIIITAYGNDELAYKAIELGANDFVSKPIRKKSFVHRLKDNMKTIQLQNHIKGLIYELKRANIKLMKQNEELYKVNKRLKTLAERDVLTKLYNRRIFFNLLEREIKRAERYGTTFSLLMMDIDDFKKINDTEGHLKGDEILVNLAKITEASIREADTVFRYGGEEFVVILPETDMEGAKIIAERIRKCIEDNLGITVSIGGALYESGLDEEELIHRADLSMYASKNSGKNKVSFFEKN